MNSNIEMRATEKKWEKTFKLKNKSFNHLLFIVLKHEILFVTILFIYLS